MTNGDSFLRVIKLTLRKYKILTSFLSEWGLKLNSFRSVHWFVYLLYLSSLNFLLRFGLTPLTYFFILTMGYRIEIPKHNTESWRYRQGNSLSLQIDEGQPVEYISEFRTVTMVLVSLVFHRTARMLHLCHLIQKATLYISKVIEKGGGQLCRIFMFEKVSIREPDPSTVMVSGE